MRDVFILDHVRTPRGRGKPDGALHAVPSVRLGATVLEALRERAGFDATLVEDVVFGCVDPVGDAGGNLARAAVLAAGYGEGTPGMQINRFCASGLEAVAIGAGQIAAGMKGVVIGGGVESMSRVGMGASGMPIAIDPSIAVPNHILPQGVAADLIASKYGFDRAACDALAVESHRRAARAWSEGRFARSVCAVADAGGAPLLDRDETVRPDASMQAMGALKPAFEAMGREAGFDAVAIAAHPDVERIAHVHHAGNSSAIVDGAAGVLIASKVGAGRIGVAPRARIRAFASVGSDTALTLTGPIAVTELALKRARMRLSDIDVIEVNEAFAAVVLRFCQHFGLDPARVNPNGGAIAMGHPLGATGAMLLGAAVDELERTGGGAALVTLCVAAGMGAAMIVERV
jgi:acetyl-CoA C-acetyltransferase